MNGTSSPTYIDIDQDHHSNIQSGAVHFAPTAPESKQRQQSHHNKTDSKQSAPSPSSNATEHISGHDPLPDPFQLSTSKPHNSINDGLVYDGIRNMRLNPVAIPDLRLRWTKKPSNILLVKKHDPDNIHRVQSMIDWLVNQRHITVYVERDVMNELEHVKEFIVETHRKLIDFCITIGGDGTVLQLSALFTGPWNVPPVMSFMGGTLGFLTAFEFNDHQKLIDQVLNSTADNRNNKDYVTVCPRMRLLCTVYRQLDKHSKPVAYKSFQPLNEMLLGRGSSPFLSIVDIFLAQQHDEHHDDELIGTVLADGLLVSSATGSTAYSMAAGGPMVSPSAPAILVTPVCPHSLSFRPIILPDVSRLSLRVSCRSRSSAVAAFDGRGQVELAPGDYVHVQMSPWPVPSINISQKTAESLWFKAITQKLHWNSGSGIQPPPLGSTSGHSLDDGCQQCVKDSNQKKCNKYKMSNKSKSAHAPSSSSSPSRRLVSNSNDPDEYALHGDAVSHHASDHDDDTHESSNGTGSDIQVTSGDRVNMIQRNPTSAHNILRQYNNDDNSDSSSDESCYGSTNCAGRIEQMALHNDNNDKVVTGSSILLRERTDQVSEQVICEKNAVIANTSMSQRQQSNGNNSKL